MPDIFTVHSAKTLQISMMKDLMLSRSIVASLWCLLWMKIIKLMFIQKYILDSLSINKFEQRKTRLVKYQRMIQCVLPPFYIKHISKSYKLISITIFYAEHNLDFLALYISGGSKGWGMRDAHPTWGPTFFNFMQFLEKNLAKLYVGVPPSPRVGAPISGKSCIHHCM